MRIDLTFEDGQQAIEVTPAEQGLTLAQILRKKGFPLNTRCGERDMCAGCTIELTSGSLLLRSTGSVLTANETPLEVRGCQVSPCGTDVHLLVPHRARLAHAPQVLETYRTNVPYADDPIAPSGLGLAVDIGTTTVVVQAVDLAKGKPLAASSGFNNQMRFGDDVLTRINLCSTDPSMVSILQTAIVQDTLAPLIESSLEASSARPEDVRALVVAGNTTMLHLLVGVDPSPLGTAPFTPRFLQHPPVTASGLGLNLKNAAVHLLPSIAAYIGADLTAGLFVSSIAYDEGPSLLVDIGTNGEILLAHRSKIVGCATAAGPAFEGSGLTAGIRAGEGAISHVCMNDSPFAMECERIGRREVRATGICGTAYVDILAEGRRVSALTPTGRLAPEFDFGDVLVQTDAGRGLLVARGQGQRPIIVNEHDIGRLLQAKAAIAAGILTLLGRFGLSPSDVKTLYLAGGFGMFISVDNAIACGLLPGFDPAQVQLVGNTSLAGATIALLDRNTMDEMVRLSQSVETIELNLETGFEDTYIDQLALP